MKQLPYILIFVICCFSCLSKPKEKTKGNKTKLQNSLSYKASEVKGEMLRSWTAYKTYAWGDDVLLPISKKGFNWYEESLGISPIDAYSTLSVMGLHKEAKEIERYAISMDWNKDIYVQVFEVNIRILGGLLAIYDNTKNPEILEKAIDFGNRLLPAFESSTGIPYHSVNLKTGETSGNLGNGKGNIINTAQAATYLLEFGILSYYSKDPKYYQAAKKASLAIFNRTSKIGLPGDYINVDSGEWTNNWSYIQAGMDSYYEYLFKSNYLFPDPEIENAWTFSLSKINTYLAEEFNGKLFYKCVNMHDGTTVKRSMSLYDAFFPAVQALHGDLKNAERNMETWHWLWNKYGLLPTRYLYEADEIEYANSELNPEIIESAYYLNQITGKEKYLKMIQQYWSDIKSCCKNETAFHSIEDVSTMKEKDYLATYFYAETLKYFYLAAVDESEFNFNDYIFNTEAHPFKRSHFNKSKINQYLGIK